MPNPVPALDSCGISPITKRSKNFTTPRRSKRKTSKRDNDVPTSGSSTPHTHSPQVIPQSMNSPSSSFPYSQDNCPDVVWDYNSPKLAKDAKKKEFKLTIQELLENLHQSQVPEGDAHPGPYVKLLENWMSKQTSNTIVNRTVKNNNQKKKKSRNAIEGLRKFIESIPKSNDATASCSSPKLPSHHRSILTASKSNTSFKSLLEGDSSTENDSTEELWGDLDNSFIVKATQELDALSATSTAGSTNKNGDEVMSTIPETLPATCVSTHAPDTKNTSMTLNVEKCNSLLEYLTNMDSDDDDDDEWQNAFIHEDDLSEIPEDVLSGRTVMADSDRTLSYTYTLKATGVVIPSQDAHRVDCCVKQDSSRVSQGVERNGCAALNPSRAVEMNSAELFNSFEDDNFEDDSLLCQPDVLSRIEEVETMMTQAPKCTPEEIEKKKVEAIKRRKKKIR